MKIYCASDFHIGYEHANYPKIIEFFELVKEKADELVLCGDILDLWRNKIDRIKNKEPMKSTYGALVSLARELPTTLIWGNHDYKIWKKVRIDVRVTDFFIANNIYYCHGWRFDISQRLGSILYGWLLNRFPYLYQKFLKQPFEIKDREKKYTELSKQTHEEAIRFAEQEDFKYIIMGHTHSPLGKGRLFDCGDMVDSLSYVVVEDGQPRIERLPREE